MPIRLASLALALLSCSEGSNPTTPDAGPLPWKPGDVRPSIRAEGPRGLLDLRGIVHAHSVYSHDACDGEPRDPVTGALNEPCVDDFRRDLCRVGHDFVMLTDHNVIETLKIVNRAYIIFEGKIIVSGSSLELINDEKAKKLYLGERFLSNPFEPQS